MEPIAPVNATVATQYQPIGPLSGGGFALGALIQARVVRVDGQTALLRWGGQSVSVTSQVPLSVGQQVNLLVEEGSAGKILLRMVDDTAGKARPARPDNSSAGRGAGASAGSATARGMPAPAGLPGRADGDASASGDGQGFADPLIEWGLTSASPGSARATPPGQTAQTTQTASAGQPATPGQAIVPGPPEATGPPAQPTLAPPAGPPGQASVPSQPTVLGQPVVRGQPVPLGQAGPAVASGSAGSRDIPAQAAPAGGPRSAWVLPVADPPLDMLFEAPGATVARPVQSPVAPRPGLTDAPDATAALLVEPEPAPVGTTTRESTSAWTRPTVRPLDTPTVRPLDTPNATATGATVLLARAAMPTYGRLAQSVGGVDAFGALLETIGRESGQTLLRAPLAPTDLGRLLVDIGVHPDEMNAVLVSELLAQGRPINEATVRTLRRNLAVAGGGATDAEATVLLSKLGLPVTPLSLGIARQVMAGQFDPRTAWADALTELQHLALGEGGPAAREIARDLLGTWRVPLEQGANGIGRWLRAVVDQTAVPLEAKFAESILTPESGSMFDAPGQPALDPAIGQDVRVRLDSLRQALDDAAPRVSAEGPAAEQTARTADRGGSGHDFARVSLQRLQATVQAEQVLNGAAAEPAGQRFFAVTLPALMGQQPTSLELQVRERDARPPEPGEAARPDVVRLNLGLPHLGDLGINLTVGHNSVACNFAAGSAFSEALIGASAGELVGRLKRLGYERTTVETAQQAPQPTVGAAAVRPEPAPRVRHVDMRA